MLEGIKPAVQLKLTKACAEVGRQSRQCLPIGQACRICSGKNEKSLLQLLPKLLRNDSTELLCVSEGKMGPLLESGLLYRLNLATPAVDSVRA